MTHVFITRRLDADSPFRQHLEAAGCKVSGRSLIQFTARPFDRLPATDWLFFYSKKAVHFFFIGMREAELSLPGFVRLAALGPGTGEALRQSGATVDFTGNGDPASVALAFGEIAAGQRVLFPRAEHSRRSVQKALGDRVTGIDLVVYHNEARTGEILPQADVWVFTSPLNARAFFAERQWQTGQKVVAIGKTTARALRSLGVRQPTLAKVPSEEALARAVLALLAK